MEYEHYETLKVGGVFYEAVEIIERLLRMDKPLVGAVNGVAVGLGATLVFYCDIVIASVQARIGDTHVKAGLVAGDDGAVAVLPFLVGMQRAKEMMLLGKILTAEQANRFGLFNEVVPHEQSAATGEGSRTRTGHRSPLGRPLDQGQPEPAASAVHDAFLQQRHGA